MASKRHSGEHVTRNMVFKVSYMLHKPDQYGYKRDDIFGVILRRSSRIEISYSEYFEIESEIMTMILDRINSRSKIEVYR